MTLAIQNNSFDGSLLELAQLRRLKSIDFNFNNFNTEIPSWFGSLHKRQHLLLKGNKFIGSIPPSLGNISSLEKLDLSYNKLSGAIPKEFENLTELTELMLRYNSLQGMKQPISFILK
ncbi:hypothetical protein Pint_11656 [Pistacia integerrima]|uniref:Uncharacterized protein n=1 Tax=Pistacia integerrima TaxID=434235 RepID=A0ACC0XKP5_9ROSI|nr:hypothetical protein Pint_11656 [Pistacia integerrima]